MKYIQRMCLEIGLLISNLLRVSSMQQLKTWFDQNGEKYFVLDIKGDKFIVKHWEYLYNLGLSLDPREYYYFVF